MVKENMILVHQPMTFYGKHDSGKVWEAWWKYLCMIEMHVKKACLHIYDDSGGCMWVHMP